MSESIILTAQYLQDALNKVRASVKPGKTFLVYAAPDGTVRELTYGDIAERIVRLSGLFRQWGLKPGDRLLIATGNDEAVITLVLSCLSSGISAVIADHAATTGEASIFIDISRPGAAVIDESICSRWTLGGDIKILLISATGRKKGALFRKLLGKKKGTREEQPSSYPDILETLEPAPLPENMADENEAYVLFTSGSTSRPKGVRISRKSLLAHTKTLSKQWEYDKDSRILNVLPLNHADGLVQGAVTAWFNGAVCLRPMHFSISALGDLLDAVYTYRATHFVAVPTILSIIDQYGEGYEDAFRTEDFRFIISAAGYLGEPLWERFQSRFGVRIANIYVLTETVTGSLFCGPDDESYRMGTVGKAVDCSARIVDDKGNEVATGKEGELLLKGEHLMIGYLNDEEGTKISLNDGWLHTGDIATVDEEGFFRIAGRKKNIIISEGLNIQPEEVSETILKIDGIKEAVAFGMPDNTFGEIVCASIVVNEGATLTPDDIITFCREHLSAYKIPRIVVPVPSLPRGPAGKVVIPEAKKLFENCKGKSALSAREGIDEELFNAAARIFHVPRKSLNSDSTPDDTPGWDSFAHLTFILELETVFDTHLSTADIMAIRSLGDAKKIIKQKFAQ